MKQISNISARSIFNPTRMLAIIWIVTYYALGYADDGYPNTGGMRGDADKDWHKLCISVKDAQPPKSDLPSAQNISALNGCVPTDLYYEAKRKIATNNADWEKVKDCAFEKNDRNVLMMLYANGFGVSKKVNLATKYACEIGGAPAEVEGRIWHLARMSDGRDDRTFDLCDDITSGYMQGICTSFEERQNARERNGRLAEITENWPQFQKEAFLSLQNALRSFAKHVSDEETDSSGSGRAAFMIEAEAAEIAFFVDDLSDFEYGNMPRFTSRQFKEYDKTLNQLYRKIMQSESMTGSRLGYTTITKVGVKNTQRAWLKYRDAWVAFGHIKYPSVAPQSWKALLTERRIKTLEHLLEVQRMGSNFKKVE